MKVAVLGSGNGGLAVAFEWAKAGNEIYLFDFPEYSKSIDEVNKKGGITSEGELVGFQKIAYAGSDIEFALKNAKLIFIVGPAYSTESFAKECKPYVKKGQIFIICPGSCAGSIVFKNGIGLPLGDESVIVAETGTLPYAVRKVGEAKIAVYNRLKGGVYIAALPSTLNEEIYKVFKPVYETSLMADNVLQTTLQNANPIIHPAITICNAALIERTGGDFYFYEEGVTEGVGRIIEAMDTERIEIGKKLNVHIFTDPELGIIQGYQAVENYNTGYSDAPGFKGIKAQQKLDYRYFNEDAGYGLVFFSSLGKLVGVETPCIDAVIKISSVIMNRDYKCEGKRTMKTLGLDKYSLEELKEII